MSQPTLALCAVWPSLRKGSALPEVWRSRGNPCGCLRAATRAAPATRFFHRFGAFPQPANFTMLGFINCPQGTASAGAKKPSPTPINRGLPSPCGPPPEGFARSLRHSPCALGRRAGGGQKSKSQPSPRGEGGERSEPGEGVPCCAA